MLAERADDPYRGAIEHVLTTQNHDQEEHAPEDEEAGSD
jgi:hypothetical protein